MATIQANFNDTIISRNALEAFVETLFPLSFFSTSYSDEAREKGAAIIVPAYGQLVATTFSQNYEVGGGTITGITVNLNIHKIVPLDLTDVQVANSSSADLEKWGKAGGQALAVAVITDVFSLITSVNFGVGVITTTSGNFSYSQLVKLRRIANEAKMPMHNRRLFLNPAAMEVLLNDLKVTGSFYTQLAQAVSTGMVLNVAGWTIVETNLLPTTDGQYAIAVYPDAIALAVRYLRPIKPDAYDEVKMLTEPQTGLTIGYRRHYQPAKGQNFVNFECLWGRGVGISAGLLRVAS